MLSFESDYITGAHPLLLEALCNTNLEQLSGYGTDIYTARAKEKISKAINCPEAQIYLAAGGTQTNQLVISTLLHDSEGVIAATTGHVAGHEAGAIEYSGHKVLTIPTHMGKILSSELSRYIEDFYADRNHEHMVYPGMVYISQPTEYGTLYTLAELEEISDICHKYQIPLFVDGARLIFALGSRENDASLEDLARISDVFYIGGTKAGALIGEAIVFTKNNMPKHFVALAKQRGALLAKGRVVGVQFDRLFTDELYMEIGRHCIEMKDKMVEALKEAKLSFFYESPTNQQFIIIENDKLERMREKVAVSFWEKYDSTHTVIRLATAFSTTEDDINALKEILNQI